MRGCLLLLRVQLSPGGDLVSMKWGGEKSLLFSLGDKNTAKILAKCAYFNGCQFHGYFLATR